MIGVVNYGLGNVRAILNIYKRLGIAASPAASPEELWAADALILPGVGAFDWAMQRLDESGMRELLEEAATVRGRPVLGICVGMQMLGIASEEGQRPGLGWIPAQVRRFEPGSGGKPRQLPHMGWNRVSPVIEDPLFAGLDGAEFYFLHSYFVEPRDQEDVLAVTDYMGNFACAIRRASVRGVQFHPEKSHEAGVQLLRNFAGMAGC